MPGSLVNWQMSYEQTFLHAAQQALAAGNIERAVNQLYDLASFLDIDLPDPPAPIGNAFDRFRALENHFHRCARLLGGGVNQKSMNIRRSFKPFAIRVKQKDRKEIGGPATQ